MNILEYALGIISIFTGCYLLYLAFTLEEKGPE